nr:hypothetical protein [Nonlabens xylanidelens]
MANKAFLASSSDPDTAGDGALVIVVLVDFSTGGSLTTAVCCVVDWVCL